MALPLTEDFTGASGALGASFTQQNASSSVGRNGSGAGTPQAVDSGTESCAFDNVNTYNNSQYSQAVVKGFTSDWGYVNVWVRASSTGATKNGYFTYTDGVAGGGHTETAKYVAGTVSIMGSTTGTFAVNDVIRIETNSTTGWTVKKNGASVGSGTDASLASGAAGMGFYWGSFSAPSMDSWEGGDVGGGGGAGKPRYYQYAQAAA